MNENHYRLGGSVLIKRNDINGKIKECDKKKKSVTDKCQDSRKKK